MVLSLRLLPIFHNHIVSVISVTDAVTQNTVSSNSSACSNSNCTCNSTTTPTRIIPEPEIEYVILPSVMGRLKVKWERVMPCQGSIQFFINFTKRMHLCSENIINLTLGKELCEERRCGEFLGFKRYVKTGYMIHENLTTASEALCNTTVLTCKGMCIHVCLVCLHVCVFVYNIQLNY